METPSGEAELQVSEGGGAGCEEREWNKRGDNPSSSSKRGDGAAAGRLEAEGMERGPGREARRDLTHLAKGQGLHHGYG